MNKNLLVLIVCATLAGCGVETASTAATVAEMKKQEIEQGQKTMARTQQQINVAMDQMHQRAAAAAE